MASRFKDFDDYVMATTKNDGKNGIFVSRVAIGDWEEYGKIHSYDVDIFVPMKDETKLCIVFGIDKVKVNGASYQIKQ